MRALVINCSPVKNGATAEVARIVAEEIAERYEVKSVSIDDYRFSFCRGCCACHKTGVCVQDDDAALLMREFESADVIVAVSPSYWADVPGQFKAFIDRCTPWCNTHEPHASIGTGKKGYAVALRTGPNMAECERIIQTIKHFFGHLEIACAESLGLCSIESNADVGPRKEEIVSFAGNI